MNIKDKTIVVDVDEVLFDTHKQFIKCLVDKFGDDPKRYKTLNQQWAMEDVLTTEECAYLWGPGGYRSPDFHRQLTFKPHAIETMWDIIHNSYEAFVLTDCPSEVQEERMKAIKSTFPNLSMYFTHHDSSQSESKSKTKAQLIELLMRNRTNKVIVLEDAPHHLEEIAALDAVETILVFDMPYNQHLVNDKFIRVHSWLDVKELLD